VAIPLRMWDYKVTKLARLADVSVTETDTSTETEDPNSQVTDEVVALTNTFGPPQFIQGECPGTIFSDVAANNTTATPLNLGEVVGGQLIEESTVLNADLWQITLEPGNYHLIADSVAASGELETIGVNLFSVTADDEVFLSSGSDSDFDSRSYEFLEIVNPETLTLRVEPVSDNVVNYELAIYPNGSAVPTTRFTRCPSTTTISLDETQSLEIPNLESIDDYRWFRMNLPAGVYNLDASAQAAEGRVVAYTFDLFQRFGDADSESRIGGDSSSGAALSNSFQFTALDDNDIWIRVSSSTGPHDIEFTVRQ